MSIEEKAKETDVGEHVKRYAEKYLSNRKINKYVVRCALCVGAIVSLILGLINGFAIPPTMLAFGIFGGVTISYLFLNLFIIWVAHFFQSLNWDNGEGAFIKCDAPGNGTTAPSLSCPERFEFGKNFLDENATAYLKGIWRREMRRSAIIVFCVSLAPLLSFSLGLVAIRFGWETAIGISVKIAYPICYFAAWVTVHVRRVYHMGVGYDFHGGIVGFLLGIVMDREKLKEQAGINCIYLYIKWYSCPKCHMVNSYKIAHINYGETFDYDRVTKSKFGTQTVGTVYLDGHKIGDIQKSYTTETHETGSQRSNIVSFCCQNCGNEMKGIQYESWGKASYTR